jgi:hypothetical protein
VRYFASAFSLVLGAWRLRISIDLEDDPEIRTLAMQHVLRARAQNAAREPSFHRSA